MWHKILTDSLHQPLKHTTSTKYESHIMVQYLRQTWQAIERVTSIVTQPGMRTTINHQFQHMSRNSRINHTVTHVRSSHTIKIMGHNVAHNILISFNDEMYISCTCCVTGRYQTVTLTTLPEHTYDVTVTQFSDMTQCHRRYSCNSQSMTMFQQTSRWPAFFICALHQFMKMMTDDDDNNITVTIN